MEGDKTFDIKALPKARKMLSRYQSLSDFIRNASLSDKMVIARFLNTGEWEETPLNLAKLDDRTVRTWGDMLLHPYVGLDTRGLTRVDVGIGANIDLIKVEKAIDRTLTESYLDPVYRGSKTKAGRMWQKMQELFGEGGLTAPAGARDQTELQAIHDARSSRSKSADESRSNALTLDPGDPRVDIWERDPGRADIIGIDTPRKSKSSNSRRTSRKSSRSSSTLTQVRGLR
jgi:hypothetical protein